MKFRLRTLFVLTAVAACVLGILVKIRDVIDFVERDAAMQAYSEGRRSREELRERFGPEVDSWPVPKQPAE